VATDILGVSGRAMLTALIEGERDVHTLAEMAKARMRSKIPQLVEALTGNFGAHHAFLCRLHLERIDQLSAAILELSARIEEQMLPFARQLEQLQTIPGVGQATAEVIIAETGGDMSRFRSAGHLASWAGVCPGHHESAGKRKSGKTRHGNRWLGAALGTAAMAAARTKNKTYLGARYQRLVPRLGKKKAIVALEHSILTATWHMLTHNVDYHDLGGDYFTRRDPTRAMKKIIRQANALGFTVRFDPIPTPLTHRAHRRRSGQNPCPARSMTPALPTPVVTKNPAWSPSFSDQEPGPLRWATVEVGKWGRARPGRRLYCDALSSWTRMVLGATDRNCRLLP